MASKCSRRCGGWVGATVAMCATLMPLTGALADPGYALIHSFDGTDGDTPNAGLLVGPGGVLYGTTTGGGGPAGSASAAGVAFSLTPRPGGGWTYRVLHRFDASTADGAIPHSRLVIGRDGALYGTTYGGGAFQQGTVYRLAPPLAGQTEWRETILHSFVGPDGSTPLSEVTIDSSGRLYGTTSFGGDRQLGTVYRLSPPSDPKDPWSLEVLHSFTGPDGRYPHGGIIARPFEGRLTLFGTTAAGGVADQGTVFALASPSQGDTAWTATVLHGFTGGADGGAPNAGVVADRSLTLFGTTLKGGPGEDPTGRKGGVAFRLTPPSVGQDEWQEVVLHAFTGGADGSMPLGGMVEEGRGRLFGTSAGAGYGGCTTRCGAAFMLTPRTYGGGSGPWNLEVLHSFSGPDGDVPSAELTARQYGGGALSFYGVTERGGANGLGGVFEVTP